MITSIILINCYGKYYEDNNMTKRVNGDELKDIYIGVGRILTDDNIKNIEQENLKNHHTLSVKITNIISDEINIKWEIYSYLTIFAEKFQKKKEEKQYFFPHVLVKNFIEFRYNIHFTEKEILEINLA